MASPKDLENTSVHAQYKADDDKREFKHVDAVYKLLSVMTGDNRYEEELYNPTSGEKEEVKNMCEVADRLVIKGKEAGRLTSFYFLCAYRT